MRRRYRDYPALLDAHFDADQWPSELADLPGRYGAPSGAIVLALIDGVPGGCVVLRGIGATVSEMKRLFVRPAFWGLGLARAMVTKVQALACARGYPPMRLEAGALQPEAIALYEAMGFTRIGPYYASSEAMMRHGRFFEAATCGQAA
jgi:GNAT superfamily N-acetyltransferase